MTETYRSIGTQTGYFVGLVNSAAVILFLSTPQARSRGAVRRWALAYGMWFIFASLIGLPFTLLFGLPFVIVGTGLVVNRFGPPTWDRATRIVVGITCFVFVGFCSMPAALTTQTIVLSDRLATESDSYQVVMVPRSEVVLHAIDVGPSIMLGRGWSSWTTRSTSKDPLKRRQSIHFSGAEWFIGPHGLQRGDAVGERLATWSGRPPVHQQDGEAEPEPEAPLPPALVAALEASPPSFTTGSGSKKWRFALLQLK